ncbi:MAG: N-acyl-D-amino-acid deacylase family protein [Acidimicrobiales bacterium]
MRGSRYDLVVRGATVYDGTGSDPIEVEVACTDGIISAIGRVVGRGAEEIDAAGLALAPGFIDPHTHLDANLFWDPDLTPSSGYGVTTVMLANCGYGLAPMDDTTRDYVIDTLSFVEQIPRDALVEGVPWDWSTLPEYFARLRRTPSLLNFGVLVGHVPLRASVLGVKAACEREANPAETAELITALRSALSLGALGFSTDQVEENRGAHGARLPGQVCGNHELLALAEALRAGPGPGLFAVAPRAMLAGRAEREADLDWHLRLAETSGRAVIAGPMFELRCDPGGAIALITEAFRRSTGHRRVVPQISTRPFELWTRLDELGVLVRCLPTLGRAVRSDGSTGARLVAVDPVARATLRAEGERMPESPVFSGRWAHVRIRYSPTRPDLVGLTVEAAAALLQTAPTDLLLDLAVADDFETQVAAAMANADDAAIANQLTAPGAMIGASDAGAHVMSNTDSCYAPWTLQHWVREQGVLTLSRAIRMLTYDQAELFGLTDRGRIGEGFAADLVLFDPDRIAVTGVRYVADQPGGGKRLVSEVTGVVASVVNGFVATRDGISTGSRPGRLVC